MSRRSVQTRFLACAVAVLGLWAARARGQECRAAGATVSVTSGTNASGHWEAAVRLERRSTAPGRGADRVALDVQPSVYMCGGTRVDAVVVKLTGPPPPPGSSYVVMPGAGYYKIHLTNVTWAEAKAICHSEGAHLLVINSEAEDKAIQELLQRQTKLPKWLFIGFDDTKKEGTYVTIFDEPLSAVGYARWSVGQPDDYNKNEDCGSLHSGTGGLNDLPCTAKTGFICEQRVS